MKDAGEARQRGRERDGVGELGERAPPAPGWASMR